MDYKRTIRFQYYQIRCKKYDGKYWGDHEAFNLVDWIVKIENDGNLRKNIEFNRTLARVECFAHKRIEDVWGVRFMKLRDTNIPSKVKENEEAEVISLEEDEYIGEDVTLLYEKCSSIALIQSNRYSLNISKMEEFIECLNEDENLKIYIDPISMNLDSDKFKKCNFRSIDISFANLNGWGTDEQKKQSLANIINPIKQMGGYTGHVTIGLGHAKQDSLNRIKAYDMISELRSNKKYVRGAKAKVRDDDSTDVEIVDLFENIQHEFIDFTLVSRTALEFRDAINAMLYRFKKSRETIYKAVNYRME